MLSDSKMTERCDLQERHMLMLLKVKASGGPQKGFCIRIYMLDGGLHKSDLADLSQKESTDGHFWAFLWRNLGLALARKFN